MQSKKKTVAIILFALLILFLGFAGYNYIPWQLHYNKVYNKYVLEGYEESIPDAKVSIPSIVVDNKYKFLIALPEFLRYEYNLDVGFMEERSRGLGTSHHITIIMPNDYDDNYHYLFNHVTETEDGIYGESVGEIDRNGNLIRTNLDENEAKKLLEQYKSEIQELFQVAQEHWGVTFS
ncbi:MAG: hypothetical protein LBS21_02850 [Clostridiales bacterium]|jgi:hypothetical protein|nr:hypothetical protein [Clostridiales bacterium]